MGKLTVTVAEARNIPKQKIQISNKVYVVVSVAPGSERTTKAIRSTAPKWNDTLPFDVKDFNSTTVTVKVLAKHRLSADSLLGELGVSLKKELQTDSKTSTKYCKKWFTMNPREGVAFGEILLDIHFVDDESNSSVVAPQFQEQEIAAKEGLEEYYELGKLIGSGASGKVHEAKSLEDGKMYAVKVIDVDALVEEDAGNATDPLIGLKREIQIMKAVRHPNIIQLYDVFIDGNVIALVMELMPNCEDLFERIEKQNGYSERQANRLFAQIVDAVAYLHSIGIAHRDLKPENMIVTGKGNNEIVKLTDFGFAKRFGGSEKLKTDIGSPAYVAPEILTTTEYTEKADMWSLGVIAYVLLSGAFPFMADELKTLLALIIAGDYDFDDPCWKDVSQSAKTMITKLLIVNPKNRYSAQELKEDPWVKAGASLPTTKIRMSSKNLAKKIK